jgi:hypothetical protein
MPSFYTDKIASSRRLLLLPAGACWKHRRSPPGGKKTIFSLLSFSLESRSALGEQETKNKK